SASGPGPLAFAIDDLRITAGRADFVDETLAPPYWAGFAGLTGTARDLAWPAASVGRFEVRGLHDEISPLAANATVAAERLDAEASAERVSAPSLNPYLAPLLGYRADSGAISLRVTGTA